MISKEYLLDLMPQLEIKEMTRHQPQNVDIFLRSMHIYMFMHLVLKIFWDKIKFIVVLIITSIN